MHGLPESVQQALLEQAPSRNFKPQRGGSDTSRSRGRASRQQERQQHQQQQQQQQQLDDLLGPPDAVRLALARFAQEALQASSLQAELMKVTAAQSADAEATAAATKQLVVARAEAATAERLHAEDLRAHAEKAAEALAAQLELTKDLQSAKAEAAKALAEAVTAKAEAAAAKAEVASIKDEKARLQSELERREDEYAEELQRWVETSHKANAIKTASAVKEALEKEERQRRLQERGSAREAELLAEVASLRLELAAARAGALPLTAVASEAVHQLPMREPIGAKECLE